MKQAPKLLAWWLRKIGMGAITLPPFGIYAIPERLNEERLARHENAHWEQYKRMGFLGFYAAYLWYSLRYGYWDNPMEIEAREAEII